MIMNFINVRLNPGFITGFSGPAAGPALACKL